jgi:ribonucleoside-diphosphate reductase alpha chain
MHRPIGIGIQGLADVFLKFRVPFDSAKARDLNKRIAETIYFGALSKSTEMCRDQYKAAVQSIRTTGKPYTQKYFTKEVRAQFPDLKREESKLVCNTVEEVPSTVGAYPSFLHNEGSPLAAGRFHWELHGLEESELSGMYDWRTLREHIMRYGVRNSLLVALMPTASTAQIMGNTSCFEPYLSNLFKRQTLAGEFIVVNKYLIHDLQESGLWSTTMKQYLIANNGSIQHIEGIPQTLKDLYKTVWELSQRCIIDMAADRQPFVDQSQSMNLFSDNFTFDRFNSMQFYGWKHALKTGCYYLRTQPATMAQKFTLDVDLQKQAAAAIQAPSLDLVPSAEPQDLCLLCSS